MTDPHPASQDPPETSGQTVEVDTLVVAFLVAGRRDIRLDRETLAMALNVINELRELAVKVILNGQPLTNRLTPDQFWAHCEQRGLLDENA